MHFLYNVSIHLYTLFVRIAALFLPKAKLWVNGRKNWRNNLSLWRENNPGKLLWMHCASLGEFEQGRPVLEAFGDSNPEVKILLTFFSPSGFEVRKNYRGADYIMYLPSDTVSNAIDFITMAQPDFVVFVKYEFWVNYLKHLKKQAIPVISISTIFRKGQRFFKSANGFWSGVLHHIDHFFVQNETSGQLLDGIGIKAWTLTGDTRFDRVLEIARTEWKDEVLERFCSGKKVLVLGSSYSTEEELATHLSQRIDNLAIVIAPHEISEERLKSIETLFAGRTMRWSEENPTTKSVLIVDNIGKLAYLYRYADLVFIGGGFGNGIHNIIEAAVYGKAVVFGSKWQKFDEARELLSKGGAFSDEDPKMVGEKMISLLTDVATLSEMGRISERFVASGSGATAVIMKYVRQKFA